MLLKMCKCKLESSLVIITQVKLSFLVNIEESTHYRNVPNLQVNLEFLEIWTFFGDNGSQQLVFETISSDSEINESGLRLHLGFVVRIGQFCV